MNSVAVEISHVSKKFRLYKERNQSLKSAVMRGRTSVHEDFGHSKMFPSLLMREKRLALSEITVLESQLC